MCWKCEGREENVVATEDELNTLNQVRRGQAVGKTWKEQRRHEADECERRRAAELKEKLLEELKGMGEEPTKSPI
jgi:hypothetical protein